MVCVGNEVWLTFQDMTIRNKLKNGSIYINDCLYKLERFLSVEILSSENHFWIYFHVGSVLLFFDR